MSETELVLLIALQRLLAESETFTRLRCSACGEAYGAGTDAEQMARAAIKEATST